jgi:hypothetical protein
MGRVKRVNLQSGGGSGAAKRVMARDADALLLSGLILFGLLLGLFLLQAVLVFPYECAEFGIVVLLAVQRIVQWAFRVFF